jgi:hypothetical protein
MSEGRREKRKGNQGDPIESNKRESDPCLICHEDFSELDPSYPMGDRCAIQPPYPKHKYHSRCLLNYYNTIPLGNRPSRNACFGCGTMRYPFDRNYANNEITGDLITDLQNRAAEEGQAQPGNVVAAAPQGYAAARAALQAVGYENLTQRQRAALFNFDPAMDAWLAHTEALREARIAAHQAAAYQAQVAAYQEAHAAAADQTAREADAVSQQQSAAAYQRAAEAEEDCPNGNCNIMGGKFRKSRRKKSRKSSKKKSRKFSRKKSRKSRKI